MTSLQFGVAIRSMNNHSTVAVTCYMQLCILFCINIIYGQINGFSFLSKGQIWPFIWTAGNAFSYFVFILNMFCFHSRVRNIGWICHFALGYD